MQVRLQKLISQAGITSRRKAEALIVAGCVTVNGTPVTELGAKADPEHDHVKVNGKLLRFERPSIYLMLNKPDGFITTLNDPEGRPTVMNLVRNVKGRLYPIGRLDYHTEGLLLMTNDGALAHALMHPSSGVMKRYHVKIKGVVDDDHIARLSRGVKLQDGITAPCTINKLRLHEKNSWLEVILHEGRYRQVRRMFEAIGRFVIRLRRVGYAGLTLGDLPVGHYRRLTPTEIESLQHVAGHSPGGRQVEASSLGGRTAPSRRLAVDRSDVRMPPGRSHDRASERSGNRAGKQAGPWTKKPGWSVPAPSGRRDMTKERRNMPALSGRRAGHRDSAKQGTVGHKRGFGTPRRSR
jgi:23S rRNA pseudouridine2605 synthase